MGSILYIDMKNHKKLQWAKGATHNVQASASTLLATKGREGKPQANGQDEEGRFTNEE